MIHKISLYGSGQRCKILCEIMQQCNSEIEVVAILDSNPDKWGHHIDGYLIESPEKLRKIHDEYLCITIEDIKVVRQIREKLRTSYQYDLKKEIDYNQLILEIYRQCTFIKQFVMSKCVTNEKISIFFDCYNGLVLGGVEAWSIDLCRALKKHGKENVYIISRKGDYHIPSILKENIVYIEIDAQKRFSMYSIKNLVEEIMKRLPCKVITSTTNEVMLAAHLVKLCYPEKIQVISVIHNSSERDLKEYMEFEDCTDYYISVSQDIRDEMIRRGVRMERISSITCPFPCDILLKRTYSENILVPIRIGYAGRLEYYQKRMDLLMKLIKLLEEEGISYEMEIAGDGSARKEMEEFVDNHHLKEKVFILGRLERTQISDFWKRQDVCVNLADFEGRSISIIEAMGNGAVPVVTSTSGVREDITDTVNGYIVPLGDYHAAAKRIKLLEKQRTLLPKLGKSAHDAVYPKSRMKPHLEFWEEILYK